MRKSTAISIILLALSGSIYARDANNDPITSIASPTLTIDFPSKNSLIQFFYVKKPSLDPDIEVYLTSAPPTLNSYYLEKIEPEGGEPIIESTFTFDADKDGKKELFILARWEIRHPGLQTSGNYYKAYVYKSTGKENSFSRAMDIEKKIGEGLNGISEGEKVNYRYRDAASIRKLLSGP